MAKLTAGRNTPVFGGDARSLVLPVAAGTEIFEGSLVMLDAEGNAVPGGAGDGYVAAGRSEQHVKNEGAADSVTVSVKRGAYIWNNDSENPITQAHVLRDCYILDDCTVTSDSADRPRAGKVIAILDEGIAVETL